MLGLLSGLSELVVTSTGDVLAKGLANLAYACGVALVNVAYVLLIWGLIASPKSVRVLQKIFDYLSLRPFVAMALAIASYFAFLLVRSFLSKQLAALQRWALRGLKGKRRKGLKESFRRGLAFLFKLRAQAQLQKKNSSKTNLTAAKQQPNSRHARAAGVRSFAVDVDPESPGSGPLTVDASDLSDISLGGSEHDRMLQARAAVQQEFQGAAQAEKRKPRVSLHLTPLRLSIEFSPKKPQGGNLRKKRSNEYGPGKRLPGWAPSMQRIPSGVELSQQGGAAGPSQSPETSEISTGTRMQEPGFGGRLLARRLMNHQAGGSPYVDNSDTGSEVDSLESVNNHRLQANNAAGASRKVSLLGAAWRAYAPSKVQHWARSYLGVDPSATDAPAALLDRTPNSTTSSRRPSLGAPSMDPVPSAASIAVPEAGTPEDIAALLTEEHLLQYRAVMGEDGLTIAMLQAKGFASPFGPSSQSLFGPSDPANDRFNAQQSSDWEGIIQESAPNIEYAVWRRPLRNKFNMYRTQISLRNARARDVRRFHLDDFLKPSWDDTMAEVARLSDSSSSLSPVQREEPPEAGLAHYVRRDSAFLYNRCKFPRPMKDREYVFARRVWDREDGGCYVLVRSCDHACYGTCIGEPKRTCQVTDYVSGMTIREEVGPDGVPLTLIETLYFEDSKLNGSFANMAVKKGLWGFVQKFESAFRLFQSSVHSGGGVGSQGGSGAVTPMEEEDTRDVDMTALQSRMTKARKSKRRVMRRVFGWSRLVVLTTAVKLVQGVISTI